MACHGSLLTSISWFPSSQPKNKDDVRGFQTHTIIIFGGLPRSVRVVRQPCSTRQSPRKCEVSLWRNRLRFAWCTSILYDPPENISFRWLCRVSWFNLYDGMRDWGIVNPHPYLGIVTVDIYLIMLVGKLCVCRLFFVPLLSLAMEPSECSLRLLC